MLCFCFLVMQKLKTIDCSDIICAISFSMRRCWLTLPCSTAVRFFWVSFKADVSKSQKNERIIACGRFWLEKHFGKTASDEGFKQTTWKQFHGLGWFVVWGRGVMEPSWTENFAKNRSMFSSLIKIAPDYFCVQEFEVFETWHDDMQLFLVISDILIFGWVAGVGAEAIRMKVFNMAAWVISKYHNGKHCLICPWQNWNSFLKQSFHCEFWARDCKLSVQVYEERKSFSNTVCNFPVKTISVLCPLKPTRNVSG